MIPADEARAQEDQWLQDRFDYTPAMIDVLHLAFDFLGHDIPRTKGPLEDMLALFYTLPHKWRCGPKKVAQSTELATCLLSTIRRAESDTHAADPLHRAEMERLLYGQDGEEDSGCLKWHFDHLCRLYPKSGKSD